MSEFPECPFCEHRLEESIPASLEGSMKIRCPACDQRYEFIPLTGSFPLDDNLGITVSKGLLGPHVVTGASETENDISLSRALLIGSVCCCTLVIIIPILVSLILSLF
jgi:hypothetical protein